MKQLFLKKSCIYRNQDTLVLLGQNIEDILHLLSEAARITGILFAFSDLLSKLHSSQHAVINSGDILSEKQVSHDAN